MSDSIKRLKLAVASATNSIRNKFKDLYSNREETKRLLDEQYKPITTKLSALQKRESIASANGGQNRNKFRRKKPTHIAVHSTLFKSHRKLSGKKTPKTSYQIPLFSDDVISDSADYDFMSADESPLPFTTIVDQIDNERLAEISKQKDGKSDKKKINLNAIKNTLDQEAKRQLQNDEKRKKNSLLLNHQGQGF